MEQICEDSKCTGCSACMNICPKGAIRIVEKSVGGYIYPVIDPSLCINCGLCEKTCPANYPVSLHSPLKAYAAISRDENDLMSSASGGASSMLAQEILRKGGAVYGCGQTNYRNIGHMRIGRVEDLWKIKDSKYVQSRIGMIYSEVKNDLNSGRQVMFTGTPCQIAGLRNYLHKDYANLLLVDLVCHGVSSQKLLYDNIRDMMAKSRTTEGDYLLSFRQKRIRTSTTKDISHKYGVFLKKDSVPVICGKKSDFPYNNYITAFMSGLILRENCFTCPYANSKRTSDITIADFWGLGPCRVPSDRGVSLILVNTNKGINAVKAITPYAHIEERPVCEAILGNGRLKSPTKRPDERDRFMNQYATSPQQAYAKNLRSYRKKIYKRVIKAFIIKYIRKIPFTNSFVYKVKHKIRKTE